MVNTSALQTTDGAESVLTFDSAAQQCCHPEVISHCVQRSIKNSSLRCLDKELGVHEVQQESRYTIGCQYNNTPTRRFWTTHRGYFGGNVAVFIILVDYTLSLIRLGGPILHIPHCWQHLTEWCLQPGTLVKLQRHLSGATFVEDSAAAEEEWWRVLRWMICTALARCTPASCSAPRLSVVRTACDPGRFRGNSYAYPQNVAQNGTSVLGSMYSINGWLPCRCLSTHAKTSA